MTNPSYLAAAVVIDSSGSMFGLKSEAEGSVNSFIESHKTVRGQRSLMLTTFSDKVRVTPSVSIEHVPPFAMHCGGMTALYDAIGTTIVALGRELEALTEDLRPGHVLVAIMTDGMENSSRDWTAARLKSVIEHQEQVYGWKFLYMGANQDAVMEAGKIGINRDSSVTYSASSVGTRSTGEILAAYSMEVVESSHAAVTDEQREAAAQQ